MSSIFFSALGHVWRRPVQAATILALPMTLNVLAELFDTHRYVMSGYEGAGTAAFLLVVVNFMTVALVAVAWHRLILLKEPQGFVPLVSDQLYRRYFAQWFVIGLVIMVSMILVFGGAAVLLGLIPGGSANALVFLDAFFGGNLVGFPLYGPLTFLTIAFTYMLFRFGVVLPRLALGHGQSRMRDGWRLTRPLAWPVAVAAVFAGLAQVALVWAPADLLTWAMADADGYLPVNFDYVYAVTISVTYTFVTLFGAAILTEIYNRIDVQDFDKA